MKKRERFKWNKENDNKLKELMIKCDNMIEIAVIMERSLPSIYTRIYERSSKDEEFRKIKDAFLIKERECSKNFKRGQWNSDEIDFLIRMYTDGVDMISICNNLNRSYHTVKRKISDLKLNGIPRLSNDEKSRIIELYYSGKNIKDIAIEINRCELSVGNVLKKEGINININTWMDDELKTLEHLLSQGKDEEYISEYLGKPKKTIINKIKEIKVNNNNKKHICVRCFEAIENEEYDNKLEMCILCKREIEEIENHKRIINSVENEKDNKIKEYIIKNYKKLSFCKKCGEVKNPNVDYYFQVKKGTSVNYWCKKCKNKQGKELELKSLSEKGYC